MRPQKCDPTTHKEIKLQKSTIAIESTSVNTPAAMPVVVPIVTITDLPPDVQLNEDLLQSRKNPIDIQLRNVARIKAGNFNMISY